MDCRVAKAPRNDDVKIMILKIKNIVIASPLGCGNPENKIKQK